MKQSFRQTGYQMDKKCMHERRAEKDGKSETSDAVTGQTG